MKLDLRAMLADRCRRLEIDYTLPPPDEHADRTINLWDVRFPSPMEVKGEIVNTAGYMRMSLNLSLDYVAPCARCLADVAGNFNFSLEKTVAPASVLEGLSEDRLDDYAIPEEGFLDMDEQLLELLELEFPSRVLCKEDCLGLCSQCGHDLNQGKCNCTREMDPRLSPLADILAEMRAKENKEND